MVGHDGRNWASDCLVLSSPDGRWCSRGAVTGARPISTSGLALRAGGGRCIIIIAAAAAMDKGWCWGWGCHIACQQQVSAPTFAVWCFRLGTAQHCDPEGLHVPATCTVLAVIQQSKWPYLLARQLLPVVVCYGYCVDTSITPLSFVPLDVPPPVSSCVLCSHTIPTSGVYNSRHPIAPQGAQQPWPPVLCAYTHACPAHANQAPQARQPHGCSRTSSHTIRDTRNAPAATC